MKKIILSSLAVAASLSALTNDEILKLYEGVPSGVKVEILDRKAVDGLAGFEQVVIKFSQGEMSDKEIMFVNGDYMVPDIVNLKTGSSYQRAARNDLVSVNLAEIYPKEDPKNIIKLGNDPKKETIVVFTDAQCPFCRREMGSIEEKLKSKNIEIIMTSVHGEDGNAISHLIYQNIAKAKSDADKIAILKKYYDEGFKLKAGEVSKENMEKAAALANKYLSAGISGVPFIIEKSKISK